MITIDHAYIHIHICNMDFPGGGSDKESVCQCRRHKRQEFPSGWEDPLENNIYKYVIS